MPSVPQTAITRPGTLSSTDEATAIPPGYKQTEVGIIPKDWNIKPLREVLWRGYLGGNYPNQDKENSRPLIKMGNVGRGNFDVSTVEYIPEQVRADPSHLLRHGDVLFNTRNTLDLVGKVAIWRTELPIAYYNSNLMRLDFDPEVVASNSYLNYALNSDRSLIALRALATGTTSVAAIYTRDLLQLAVIIPPKCEQRAIAEALSDVDKLLGSLEKLIAKKRAIKQAAMQQLLTGKTRLPGFSGEWETKRVSEFGAIVTGATPRTDIDAFWGEEYPWITPTDISSERDMISSERMITQEGLSSIRMLPANSVLVTCIASIGKNAILRTKGACNQQINAVIPSLAYRPEFLYYLFEFNPQYLLSNAGMTATSIVSRATFCELSFEVPPLTEQKAIATVLSDMDAEITALERRRDKTRTIKQGMMQQLLTGRVRLVRPEPDGKS